ncbi:hypothetical protein ACIOGZ_36005 [Kitasatospora sp. NPDC088160]|uniref:hypothetical protein n=1 Tax=Kitasatospora sp. NPDC088160 TaxID=3364072 RepID=UPI00382B601C
MNIRTPSRFTKRSAAVLLAVAALAFGVPSVGVDRTPKPHNPSSDYIISGVGGAHAGHRLSVPGVSMVMRRDGNLVMYLMAPDRRQGPLELRNLA